MKKYLSPFSYSRRFWSSTACGALSRNKFRYSRKSTCHLFLTPEDSGVAPLAVRYRETSFATPEKVPVTFLFP